MEFELTKLGERGQAVIPKAIREKMLARKGTLFGVVLMDKDTIDMRRIDKSRLYQEYSEIRSNIKKIFGSKIIEEIENI